jgi:hypothetical protein
MFVPLGPGSGGWPLTESGTVGVFQRLLKLYSENQEKRFHPGAGPDLTGICLSAALASVPAS